jgi:hypothetical protein
VLDVLVLADTSQNAKHRVGNTIDLGEKGFSDHDYTQRIASCRQVEPTLRLKVEVEVTSRQTMREISYTGRKNGYSPVTFGI